MAYFFGGHPVYANFKFNLRRGVVVEGSVVVVAVVVVVVTRGVGVDVVVVV